MNNSMQLNQHYGNVIAIITNFVLNVNSRQKPD